MIYATYRDPDWTKWLGGAMAGALLMVVLERARHSAAGRQGRTALPGPGRGGAQVLGGSLNELGAVVGSWAGMARGQGERSDSGTGAAGGATAPASRAGWPAMLRAAALLGGALGYYWLNHRTPSARVPAGPAAAGGRDSEVPAAAAMPPQYLH